MIIYDYIKKKYSVPKKRLPIFKNDNYHDDTAFQFTNKHFITLNDEERKTNNKHLKKVKTFLTTA